MYVINVEGYTKEDFDAPLPPVESLRRKATIPLYSAQRSKALYYFWGFKQTHMQNQHIKYLNKDLQVHTNAYINICQSMIE